MKPKSPFPTFCFTKGVLVLALLLGLVMLTGREAQGASSIVSNNKDSGTGSLRQIILNSTNGTVIGFDTDGTFYLTNGEFLITNNLTIRGDGTNFTILDGNLLGRIFNIVPGASLTLSSMTIQHGISTNGGGIYNAGSLMISNVLIASCQTSNGVTVNNVGTDGGNGGAIYNSGAAQLINATVRLNACGKGGDGSLSIGTTIPNAGNGGNGGGIYSAGYLSVTNSTFIGNTTGAGGVGGFADVTIGANGGNGGSGAAIYSLGTVALTKSLITNNMTGAGGSGGMGGGNASGTSLPGGNGGSGGSGSGIYSSGTLLLTNSAIASNTNGAGGNGGLGGFGVYPSASSGNGGKGGDGGIASIFNSGLMASAAVLVLGNTAGKGGIGGPGMQGTANPNASVPQTGGAGGTGGNALNGGVFNSGILTFLLSNYSNNISAGGGDGGIGGTGASGNTNNANGNGGTGGVGGNGGLGGPGLSGGSGGAGGPGGLATGSGSNGATGAAGIRGGTNNAGTANLFNAGQVYGYGPTPTALKVLSGGVIQLSFTNTNATNFSVVSSTSLNVPYTNWTFTGAITQSSPGLFQFTDADAPNHPQRFYLLRLP